MRKFHLIRWDINVRRRSSVAKRITRKVRRRVYQIIKSSSESKVTKKRRPTRLLKKYNCFPLEYFVIIGKIRSWIIPK